MRKLAIALMLLAVPAEAARIECITTATTVTVDANELSATALQTSVKDINYNIEIYSDDDAASAPATCTAADATVVTCNGWDTSGSAEVWWRCDQNAPFLKMSGTGTYTAPVNIGWTASTDCQIRLKLVTDGDTNSACLYLAVTGPGDFSDPTKEVQDESSKGAWAVVP